MSTVYSIKDLEKLSGIKAHTLRIWEKRYGIIQPKRTDTNIRYFLDEDVRHVLNIALLNKHGIKISHIAKMEATEISSEVSKLASKAPEEFDDIEAMIVSILELNEKTCKHILNTIVERLGFEKSIEEFIYPLLDKLGLMWISGTLKSVHEKFTQTLLRNKVSSEIEKLPIGEQKRSKFLIYLPEQESHELSMLFLQFIIKKRGAEVLNLGNNIKVDDLLSACQIYKPDYAFTIINDSLDGETLQSFVDFITNHLPNVTHLFSGFQFVKHEIDLNSNCKYIQSLNAVEHYI